MFNPDNKCFWTFVKVSFELIPEHLLCKYNEHLLITWQIFDHMIPVFSVHSRGYLSCIFNLWRLIILKGSKLCIQLESVSSCVTNPQTLCQWMSHCDLLTTLDISDTVSKSKLYNLLEAISETHDNMPWMIRARRMGAISNLSTFRFFFCFDLSIGVKNSRIKMNQKLINHDFWWIEFYFSSSSFHFMSDLYNKCQFQLSNHRRLYRIISFLTYPHFPTVG